MTPRIRRDTRAASCRAAGASPANEPTDVTDSMLCRVFYYLSAEDEEVPSSRPIDLPAARVWGDLVACLQVADDYVGLVDAADNVLQISLDGDDGGYWVELPIADEHLSYGRRMSASEVRQMLEKLPGTFRRRNFPDFERRPW